MSEDQISTPVFLVILVILGFIIRYLFFNGAGANAGAQSSRSPEARLRAGEIAVERIQQMFPQTERRAILWDLQRNGMNIQATIERILSGGLETVWVPLNRSISCPLLLTWHYFSPRSPSNLPRHPQPIPPPAQAPRQQLASPRSRHSRTSSRGTISRTV